MTWQDELQHLDAELAAGRISAEDYRQRRDAVLTRGQAEQPGTPSGGFPQQAPAQGAPQGGPQSAPQSGQNPFPPAFNWGGAPGQGFGPQPPQGQPPQGQQNGGGDSDSTQVVNVNQVAGPPVSPQPSPPHGTPQPSPPHGTPQQGPVAPGQQGQPPYGWPNQQPPPPQHPPQGQPPQQPWPDQSAWGPQQGWGPVDNGGTPWGDSDLPPEHGDTSWMRQGPEVFESAGKSSKGKVLGLSVGGVLVVALIVAGVFFFTSGGGGTETRQQADKTQQQAPPPTPTTPDLPEPPPAKPAPADPAQVLIPPPPGPPHPFNGPLTRPALEGAKSGVLTDPVRKAALSNGMVDGWFHGTDGTKAPVATTLIAIKMPDEAAASRLAQTYLDSQEGLSNIDDLSYRGVKVMSTGSTFRTAYTSHSWTIIVDVRAVKGPGKDARVQFKDLLAQQLTKMPPTVRK